MALVQLCSFLSCLKSAHREDCTYNINEPRDFSARVHMICKKLMCLCEFSVRFTFLYNNAVAEWIWAPLGLRAMQNSKVGDQVKVGLRLNWNGWN